jgi:hypothetical protein
VPKVISGGIKLFMVYFDSASGQAPARVALLVECVTANAQICCVPASIDASPLFGASVITNLHCVGVCLKMYVSAVDSPVSVFGRANFGHGVRSLSSPPDQFTLAVRGQSGL